jgi:kynurenine formamidase
MRVIIDLTMRITPSIRVYPGSPQPSFIPWSRFDQHGYDSEAMFMSTHTGTHVDAPSHFKPGLASIDMISTDRLVCNAILIRARKTANQLIEQQDFGNQIRQGDAVVIATGWEKRSGMKNYMSENPGLSEEAARYLARKRVNAVAIDCPSIDAGTDSKFTAHNILLPSNILVVENLCNLDKVVSRSSDSSSSSSNRSKNNKNNNNSFTLIISPLKLGGATGSPARVLALL